MFSDNPVLDAEKEQMRGIKPVGICEQCGRPVYYYEHIEWEEDAGYKIPFEGIYLHDDCLKKYARKNWSIDNS